MSWTDRLRRLTVGDPRAALATALRDLHQASAERAERFAADAAQAPTAGAEHELQALATRESAVTQALAAALTERGAPPGTTPAPLRNGTGPSHWARLVTAMDTCRDAHNRLARHRAHLVELDPSLARLLDTLIRCLDDEIATLRDLVARADPHALN